ncbi:HupE/UreJ family protein [Roseibium sp.]|uniref:HupE/UreJ family protein n=1 Tax=Roseibium sp. TaxID=1936156 RepID=UPI003A97CC65
MRHLWLLVVLVPIVLLCPAPAALGHALQPGYAALEQTSDTDWRIFWRKPDVSGKPMAIDLELPAVCTPRQPPPVVLAAGAWEAGWSVRCNAPLTGLVVNIPGLERTQTDVLVRFAPLYAPAASLRLTPDAPSAELPKRAGLQEIFITYAGLGFEHILEGWDHLLFVFALMILIRDAWRLFGAVTAFTLAHSLTLAGSTLGWFSLPSAPVEAVIALSIVFLAREIAASRPGAPSLAESAPWLVTFAFGLLHGLGFAGALKEIGLPQSDIPLALFAFNVGVEAGQLAFIAVAGALLLAATKIAQWHGSQQRRLALRMMAYGIGGWSSYWLIERTLSFA